MREVYLELFAFAVLSFVYLVYDGVRGISANSFAVDAYDPLRY